MFVDEQQRQKILFAAVDEIALVAAFGAAWALYDPAKSIPSHLLQAGVPLLFLGAVVLALAWMLVFRAFDLYRLRNGGRQEQVAVLKACTAALAVILLLCFLIHLDLSRVFFVIAYLLSAPFVMAARSLTRRGIRNLYSDPRIATPLVVVGFNQVARYLCDQILDELSQYELLGFIDSGGNGAAEYRGCRVLGGVEQIGAIAAEHPGLEAAIALSDAPRDEQERIIRLCEREHVRWRIVPWLCWPLEAGFSVDVMGVVPLLTVRGCKIEGLNFVMKRAFDIAVAGALLLATGPLMLAAAVSVWLIDGRPVLFRQKRVGIHGRTFELLKFRTMHAGASDSPHREYVKSWIRSNGAPENGSGQVFKLTADSRITPLGRFLRRFSIDELPQLVNVVRGDMSLIGPRPAVPYELELYQDWHRQRLDAPPGITGLWQVSGRNQLGFDDMVRLDIEYLEGWTLAGDLRILARTVPVLFRGGGH